MVRELKRIITKEKEALSSLLTLLEKQHKCIIDKNVFELDALVDEFKIVNKEVAIYEVERRKFLNGRAMKEVVSECNDKELERLYRDIKMILSSIQLQKDTNDLLIKQQLSYTNRMLNIINPQRNVGATYNSRGKV